MEILKLLFPLATFLLGSVLTLYMSRRNYGKSVQSSNVTSVCELSQAWYDEVFGLWSLIVDKNGESGHDDREFPAFSRYYFANQYLVKYRRSIETLRHFPRCDRFVLMAESFLESLTVEKVSHTLTGGPFLMFLRHGGYPKILECRLLEPLVFKEREDEARKQGQELKELRRKNAGAVRAQSTVEISGQARIGGSPFLSQLNLLLQAIHVEAARLEDVSKRRKPPDAVASTPLGRLFTR